MADNSPDAYKLPDPLSNMTIHYSYGFDMPGDGTVAGAMSELGFALAGDFIASGFPKDELLALIRSGDLNFAHWPEKKPVTDLLWDQREGTAKSLGKLAATVKEIAGRSGPSQPEVTNFVWAGAEVGSQGLALAGLIYARHTGLMRELPEELADEGMGPLYVVRGSFSDQMFERLLGGRDASPE